MFHSIAAVDTHTGEHIVEKCLSGPLAQDRTILLVTHHVSLCLPAASYLVELSRGEILRKGFVRDFEDLGQLQEIVEAENEATEETLLPTEGPENEADTIPKSYKNSDNQGSKGKLIEIETRAEGRVSWLTYWTYIRAAGIICWIFTLLLMVLIRAINIGNQASIIILAVCKQDLDVLSRYSWLDGVLRTTCRRNLTWCSLYLKTRWTAFHLLMSTSDPGFWSICTSL